MPAEPEDQPDPPNDQKVGEPSVALSLPTLSCVVLAILAAGLLSGVIWLAIKIVPELGIKAYP